MTTQSAFVYSATRRYQFHSRIVGHFLRFVATLALLVAGSAAAMAQATPGTITKLTLKSAVLGEERTILVRTPNGYDLHKNRYPVLYLTDGDAHIGHTSSTIDFLARNGRMAELIVVGIANTDRTRDLTPVKSKATNAAGELQAPTSGGADNFLKFIETELIPEIEKRYRTHPYRILAGHSLGGLFAVHAMIARPGVFKSYVAVSPALQFANEEAIYRAEKFFKDQKELNATLVVTLGNEPGGIGESFEGFKSLLEKTKIKGFEWQALKMNDEDHGSVVMPSHYAGLRKVFDGWQMPRDPMTGAIAGNLKTVDEHYWKLSQKFGYTIAAPENLINQVGYQELFAGRNEEAIAVFKANVERYPASANVYDSLAEAYERSGQIDLAGPLYEKAQVLGQQNNDPNLAIYKTNYLRVSEKLKETQAKKTQEQ
jgi:predicted alpha/beta superfamily hydrolase